MIKIEVTDVEAQGYNLAGNAPDDLEAIETQIALVLTVGGMPGESARFLAQKLAKGALSARAKVKAATAYELVIITPPKPSTILKKPKKAKK